MPLLATLENTILWSIFGRPLIYKRSKYVLNLRIKYIVRN